MFFKDASLDVCLCLYGFKNDRFFSEVMKTIWTTVKVHGHDSIKLLYSLVPAIKLSDGKYTYFALLRHYYSIPKHFTTHPFTHRFTQQWVDCCHARHPCPTGSSPGLGVLPQDPTTNKEEWVWKHQPIVQRQLLILTKTCQIIIGMKSFKFTSLNGAIWPWKMIHFLQNAYKQPANTTQQKTSGVEKDSFERSSEPGKVRFWPTGRVLLWCLTIQQQSKDMHVR